MCPNDKARGHSGECPALPALGSFEDSAEHKVAVLNRHFLVSVGSVDEK
jgi:hypothetical protein